VNSDFFQVIRGATPTIGGYEFQTSTTSTPSSSSAQGAPSGYAFCANENSTCLLNGTMDVAYGANGSFFYKYNQTGSIGCNNGTFGGDPIPGVAKSCYVTPTTATAIVGPAGYTKCANEDETITLNTVTDVAYGANGIFFYLYGLNGSVTFSNTFFGGDPVPNVVKYGFCK
jgi:hypothetical protein